MIFRTSMLRVLMRRGVWMTASLWITCYGFAYSVDQLELRAQLSPRRFTTLAAELAAKVDHIHVAEGEKFASGQVLVEFDASLLRAQLAKAHAHLKGVENLLEGNRSLAALNAIGHVELINSEVEVMKAKADLNYLQLMIDKCSIRAPYAGRVVALKAREGQFVQAGQAMLEVLDDSELELDFFVPSRWLVWLRVGQSFVVSIDETGREYPSRLVRIGARADPVSQSLKVAAVIDGDFSELISGMSGHVLLTPPENE
jgi:membrane fusion protein, multidrug efflux system